MVHRPAIVLYLSLVIGCGLGRSPGAAPADSRAILAAPSSSGIEVIWIGHATALIRLGDRWILTDPNFSERIGLVYERYVDPGLRIEDLPALDAVLISHAHLDHLDNPSLQALRASKAVIAPPDALSSVDDNPRLGKRIGLDDWQDVDVDGMTITAVPAHHGHGRYYLDALWRPKSAVGYVIAYGDHSVYFAGDTGFDPASAHELRARFPHLDVALIPVGPADRAGWVHALRKSVHAGPQEAIALFEASGARWMIPIHYGTFFKRTVGEHQAIADAIAASPTPPRIRQLEIGGAAGFDE